MKLIVPQRHYGPRLFFAVVIVIFLIQILAIDMYVPALPLMQRELDVSAAELNTTIFVFLIVQAASMVIAGPLADRFGRRPILTGGCALFLLGSIGCMLTPNVPVLTVARAVQALGLGSTATLSSTLIKDAYAGRDLTLTMTLLQSLIIIGPIFAPFIGSFLIVAIGWRGIFATLVLGGIVTTVLALLFDETYRPVDRAGLNLSATFRTMAHDAAGLVHKRGFTALALFIGVTGIPFFAFIATSSYILLDDFGLGYWEYSVVYAVACAANCAAPFVYLGLSRVWGTRRIMLMCVALTAASFVALALAAPAGAVWLLIGFIPYAFAEGIARPAAYLVLLDQPHDIVGTASAFGNFTYGVITALATVAATLPWPSFLFGLTALTGLSALGAAILYLLGRASW